MQARISRIGRISAVLLFLTLPAAVTGTAWAHHAVTEYDTRNVVEIEGTLIDFKWQNPHVRLRVSSKDAQGKQMVWEIESSSLSILRRTNASPERLHVGDKIKVAGELSRTAPNRMYALNLLHADGTELVFLPGMRPRWSKTTIGSVSTWLDPGRTDKAGLGIFRVWSTQFDVPEQFWLQRYPLTEAAQKIRASWNPLTDTVARDCEPKGMPTIMEQPYPLEFVQQKDTIQLRMEEYDTVRTIYLDNKVVPTSLPKSRLGRSIGRWDGATLVVKTDGITWPHLDPRGTPLSPGAMLIERFTPTPDETRLQYSVVITDPKFLTAPVELKRSWVARPNESVKPYNCGRT